MLLLRNIPSGVRVLLHALWEDSDPVLLPGMIDVRLPVPSLAMSMPIDEHLVLFARIIILRNVNEKLPLGRAEQRAVVEEVSSDGLADWECRIGATFGEHLINKDTESD